VRLNNEVPMVTHTFVKGMLVAHASPKVTYGINSTDHKLEEVDAK
jgi:hypothetical protein